MSKDEERYCESCDRTWIGTESESCPQCKFNRQQAEIVRWMVATGRHDPEEITYTQDEAVFWQRKAELYATQREEARQALRDFIEEADYTNLSYEGLMDIVYEARRKYPWLENNDG